MDYAVMDHYKIGLLSILMLGLPTLVLLWEFAKWVAKPAKDKLPINHLLGRVFPMPDDPLWESSPHGINNNSYFVYKDHKNSRDCIRASYYGDDSWTTFSLGIPGHPYSITGDTRSERKAIKNYCKVVRDNVVSRDWAKFNAEKQTALDKINYV